MYLYIFETTLKRAASLVYIYFVVNGQVKLMLVLLII